MTFTGPRTGPCEPYTTWADVIACGDIPDIDEALQPIVIDVATDIVFGLTHGQLTGACERTVAPCWRGRCGCSPCSCAVVNRLDLGALPVWGVSEIRIADEDGVLQPVDNTDGAAYYVEDWRWLVYRGGPAWPRCQGDWEIDYTFGNPVLSSVGYATALIVRELAKQCAGGACALDAQTTNYSREGLTVQLAVPDQVIAQGFTGIRLVDIILGRYSGRGGGIFDPSQDGRAVERTWDLADVDA